MRCIVMTNKKDSILSIVHDSAKDMHHAGTMDKTTMREFDALCLAPVKAYKPDEIRRLRMRLRVSQSVFATYLNVSKTSVMNWESGQKKPGPAATKLLNLADRKSLEGLS